jgi:hypothetical protein
MCPRSQCLPISGTMRGQYMLPSRLAHLRFIGGNVPTRSHCSAGTARSAGILSRGFPSEKKVKWAFPDQAELNSLLLYRGHLD